MSRRVFALITGAGSGIGEHLTKKFVREGIDVIIIGRRKENLDRVILECNNYSNDNINNNTNNNNNIGKVHKIVADISKIDSTELYDNVKNNIVIDGDLKYLIHNAAIGDPGIIGKIDIDHFRYAMEVNVISPLAITQALLPLLRRLQSDSSRDFSKRNYSSRILHLGTGVAHFSQLGTGTYGITKQAFHRLYQQMKIDLQQFDDTNNCSNNFVKVLCGSVRPGICKTEGLDKHLQLADELALPHAEYFHGLFSKGNSNETTHGTVQDVEHVANFLFTMLRNTTDKEFDEKEWSINEKTRWWDPHIV